MSLFNWFGVLCLGFFEVSIGKKAVPIRIDAHRGDRVARITVYRRSVNRFEEVEETLLLPSWSFPWTRSTVFKARGNDSLWPGHARGDVVVRFTRRRPREPRASGPP
jgi:hypothetical protein